MRAAKAPHRSVGVDTIKMSGNVCLGSFKAIGRIPVQPGQKIICEVCGQECHALAPSPEKMRTGVQFTYSLHFVKAETKKQV